MQQPRSLGLFIIKCLVLSLQPLLENMSKQQPQRDALFYGNYDWLGNDFNSSSQGLQNASQAAQGSGPSQDLRHFPEPNPQQSQGFSPLQPLLCVPEPNARGGQGFGPAQDLPSFPEPNSQHQSALFAYPNSQGLRSASRYPPPRLPLGLCLQSWLLPWPTARSSPILNAAFGSHNRLKLRLPWALLILCPVPLSVTVAVPRSQLPLQLILSPQQ